MRRAFCLFLDAAGLLAASAVFYMNLEESLDFTEAILLVRVESVIEFPDDQQKYAGVMRIVPADSLESILQSIY